MKKILTILAVMTFTTTMAMALDGDTYREEREQVEGLANSSYIQVASTTDVQTGNATAETKTKVVKKKRYRVPSSNSYYHFGTIGGFKGSNGH